MGQSFNYCTHSICCCIQQNWTLLFIVLLNVCITWTAIKLLVILLSVSILQLCWTYLFSLQVRAEAHREAGECPQMGATRTSPTHPRVPDESCNSGSEPVQSSHFLYVPNNTGTYTNDITPRTVWLEATSSSQPSWFNRLPLPLSSPGLNSLNLFLPASHSPASLALPPTLAVPYVLVPSAALSHYPLVASGVQQPGSHDAHAKLSFSLPTVMAPYSLAAPSEISWSAAPAPSTPKQSRLHGSAAGTPHSPARARQTVNISTPEPLVSSVCVTRLLQQILSSSRSALCKHSLGFIMIHELSSIRHNTAWHESGFVEVIQTLCVSEADESPVL